MSQLCGDVTLNVSQPQQRSVILLGIMPRNIGTFDGRKDLKRKKKELGQRTGRRKLENSEGKQKRLASSHCLEFGPVAFDWLTVLGHIDLFTSPTLSFPSFFVTEQVSPKAIRCCQARHVYV